jgi:hypothetical protein
VNGDGFADVVVGADDWDSSHSDGGQAAVYYGSGGDVQTVALPGPPGGGKLLLPRQRRADNSQSIARLGRSDTEDSFRLAAIGRTPFGRGQVKLEWEVKPLGTLFDGLDTGETALWRDTQLHGVNINRRVRDLNAGTVYHWRVRLLYHPANLPFQPHSRWFTMPWNGWQESDLRTMGDVNAIPPLVADPMKIQCRAFPSPFGQSTALQLYLPEDDEVTLELFDIAGRRVARLLERSPQESGFHTVTWPGTDDEGRHLAPGVYFYRLEVGETVLRGKLMHLR